MKANDFFEKYPCDQLQVKRLIDLKESIKNKNESFIFSEIPSITIDDKEKLKMAFIFIENLLDEKIKNQYKKHNIQFLLNEKWAFEEIPERDAIIKILTDSNLRNESTSKNVCESFLKIFEANHDFFKHFIIKINFTISTKNNKWIKIDLLDKETYLGSTKKEFKEIENTTRFMLQDFSEIEWINNVPYSDKSLIEKLSSQTDYNQLKAILLKRLKDFATENLKKGYKFKKFDPFSISFLGRWGSGKTTIIRALKSEFKDLFNFVEISLWSISNSLTKNDSSNWEYGENHFIKMISREIITQLTNNPNLVENYFNGSYKFNSFKEEFDAQNNLTRMILRYDDKENIEVTKNKTEFIEQYIHYAERIMYMHLSRTNKPTIIVFDDLDRIQDNEHVLKILDALVSFYLIKNAIYIVTVDESKITSALSQRNKNDFYKYMTKYFNHTIRCLFTPKLNLKSIIKTTVKDNCPSLHETLHDNEEWFRIASQTFPHDYRSINDHLNLYISNTYSLQRNDYFKKTYEHHKDIDVHILYLFVTLIQINYPMLVDIFISDFTEIYHLIEYKEIIEIFNKEHKEKKVKDDIGKIENNFIKTDEDFLYFLNTNDELKKYKKFLCAIFNIDIENQFKKSSNNSKEKYSFLEYNISTLINKFENFVNNFCLKYKTFLSAPNPLLFWISITNTNVLDEGCISFISGYEFLFILFGENLDEKTVTENINKVNNDSNYRDKFNKFILNIYDYVSDGFISLESTKLISTTLFTKKLELKYPIFINNKNEYFFKLVDDFKSLFDISENIIFENLDSKCLLLIWEELDKHNLHEIPIIKESNSIDKSLLFKKIISMFSKYIHSIKSNVPKDIKFEDDCFLLDFLIKNDSNDSNDLNKIIINNLIPYDLELDSNNDNKEYINKLINFYSKQSLEIKNINIFIQKVEEKFRDIKTIVNLNFKLNPNKYTLLYACKNLKDFSLLPLDFLKQYFDDYYKLISSIPSEEILEIILNTDFIYEKPEIIDWYLEKQDISLVNFINSNKQIIENHQINTSNLSKYLLSEWEKIISQSDNKNIGFFEQEYILNFLEKIDKQNIVKSHLLKTFDFNKKFSYPGEPLLKNTPFDNIVKNITKISDVYDELTFNYFILNKSLLLISNKYDNLFEINKRNTIVKNIWNNFQKFNRILDFDFFTITDFRFSTNFDFNEDSQQAFKMNFLEFIKNQNLSIIKINLREMIVKNKLNTLESFYKDDLLLLIKELKVFGCIEYNLQSLSFVKMKEINEGKNAKKQYIIDYPFELNNLKKDEINDLEIDNIYDEVIKFDTSRKGANESEYQKLNKKVLLLYNGTPNKWQEIYQEIKGLSSLIETFSEEEFKLKIDYFHKMIESLKRKNLKYKI